MKFMVIYYLRKNYKIVSSFDKGEKNKKQADIISNS